MLPPSDESVGRRASVHNPDQIVHEHAERRRPRNAHFELPPPSRRTAGLRPSVRIRRRRPTRGVGRSVAPGGNRSLNSFCSRLSWTSIGRNPKASGREKKTQGSSCESAQTKSVVKVNVVEREGRAVLVNLVRQSSHSCSRHERSGSHQSRWTPNGRPVLLCLPVPYDPPPTGEAGQPVTRGGRKPVHQCRSRVGSWQNCDQISNRPGEDAYEAEANERTGQAEVSHRSSLRQEDAICLADTQYVDASHAPVARLIPPGSAEGSLVRHGARLKGGYRSVTKVKA